MLFTFLFGTQLSSLIPFNQFNYRIQALKEQQPSKGEKEEEEGQETNLEEWAESWECKEDAQVCTAKQTRSEMLSVWINHAFLCFHSNRVIQEIFI